jgi:hypothetical protein
MITKINDSRKIREENINECIKFFKFIYFALILFGRQLFFFFFLVKYKSVPCAFVLGHWVFKLTIVLSDSLK